MAIEYERKFAATPEKLRVAEKELKGNWFAYKMKTTYFDTATGSLSARKWMLRLRKENGAQVCTLKTPAGNARNEWETTAECIAEGVEKLCKLGAPQELLALTADGVRPICGAEFTRLAGAFALDGAEVEVALDEGALFAGDRKTPLCELEVELKSGSREAADGFALQLAQQFGLTELHDSKFKRARALMEFNVPGKE